MGSEKLKFLGLGSMVEVDDMDALLDTKYVVIARAIGKNSKGETILRYQVAPHPFGDIPTQKENILTITGNQVKEVLTQGYTDEKDEALLDELLGKMNRDIGNQVKSSTPSVKTGVDNSEAERKKAELKAQEEAKRIEMERLEKEQALLRRDPFYKFRKKVRAK